MFRACSVAAVLLFLTAICAAQSTATCNLPDDRQVYIRYKPVSAKSEHLSNGKPWSPGGAPMTLFTEAELTSAERTIPLGAYTVYPIPAKDKWSLVVNKNVTSGAAYDEKQDLAALCHGNCSGLGIHRYARNCLRPLRLEVHASHLLRQSRLVCRFQCN